MTLIVVAQMYVADIIGKLSEKLYRIYPRKIRLLDIKHHVKIAAEAAFELVHKFRRLPIVMDDILLCEDYPCSRASETSSLRRSAYSSVPIFIGSFAPWSTTTFAPIAEAAA